MKALRGVNLGGWFVLERWMTPSLFAGTDAVDEYTFMEAPGARAKLRQFQKTFITDADWQWMADNGVQIVRIPVGYWILEGDEPYLSSIGRLDWAFRMAAQHGIQVLLCLHGAPGSQNGRDHSGRIGKSLWYRRREYREQTIETLERLALRYRDSEVFWGLELLNEPRLGVIQCKLRQFYNQAYRRLTKTLRTETRIVFHDAFTPRMLSAAICDRDNRPVMMDIHWYHFAFWAHRWIPITWYYRLIVAWHGRLISSLQRWQGIIIGEWNGIISGEQLRRYPQEQHDSIVDEHIAWQLRAYDGADAWFYWNYKTDDPGVWNFRSLVDDGRISLK